MVTQHSSELRPPVAVPYIHTLRPQHLTTPPTLGLHHALVCRFCICTFPSILPAPHPLSAPPDPTHARRKGVSLHSPSLLVKAVAQGGWPSLRAHALARVRRSPAIRIYPLRSRGRDAAVEETSQAAARSKVHQYTWSASLCWASKTETALAAVWQ